MDLNDRPEPRKMRISFASPPDREHLVAEIFCGDEQWAEINTETGRVTLELYAQRSGEPWVFAYDEAMAAIVEARRRLREE